MRKESTPRTVDRVLLPGKVVRICAGHGGALRAREGVLWVTYEARGEDEPPQPHDHFMAGGECLHLDAGDVVVVSASDARYGLASFDWEPVRLLPAAAPQPRWAGWLAALLRRRPAGGLLAA